MIIFLDLNGQIVQSDLTERIGRNSTDVNKIYILSKLAPETLFYFSFRLPNGVNLFGNLAALVNGESAGDMPAPAVRIGEAEGFTVWAYSTKEDVTRYAGRAEFSLYGILEGGARTATSGSFVVDVGVRPTVPTDPSGSEWDTILALLRANAADIAALEDRMTAAEAGIAANRESIGENRESISALGERMTAAEEDIADNADDIAANADDIAANAASINRIDTALTAQEDLNRSVERRLGNLEIGTLDTVEKSGEAYAVNMPADALPWVSVDKIGGKTRVELTETGATVADGGVTLNGTLDESPTFYSCNVAADTVDRDDYAVVIDVLGGSYSGGTPDCFFVDSYSIGNVLGAKIPNALGRYVYHIDASSIKGGSFMRENGLGTMGIHAEGVTFNDFCFNITLYEGVIAELVSTPVTAVKTVGKNLLPDSVRSIAGWNETTANTGGKRYNYPLDLPVGTYTINTRANEITSGATFTLQRNVNGGDYSTVGIIMQGANVRNVPYTFSVSEGERCRLYLTIGNALSAIINGLQLERGATATDYVPYTERTYPIPEAVQELEGYGESLPNGLLNYVDPVNGKFVREVGKRAYQTGDVNSADMLTDGVTTIYPLASPIVTDLGDDSPALTDDGYLEMEANGWIYLVNESESAVPYAITYQKTKGA